MSRPRRKLAIGQRCKRLGLRDVHAAAHRVYGRAQHDRTRGDHNDQDSQRDNQQFEAVDATRQWIAAGARRTHHPWTIPRFA